MKTPDTLTCLYCHHNKSPKILEDDYFYDVI